MSTRIRTRLFFVSTLISVFTIMLSAKVSADLVFDLRAAGAAGAALDAGAATSFTQMGVTLSVATSTTLAGATGSRFNTVSAGAGVDSLGVGAGGGDAGSQIDAEETMTLTFTFTEPSIDLLSIDFAGQSGNASGGDTITVNINGTNKELFTGATDYNGTSDLWTPMPAITIGSGSTFIFSGQDEFRVAQITFSAVPEPTSMLLFGMAISGLGFRRRRA